MALTFSGDALATKAVKRLNQLMGEIGTESTNFQVLIPDLASQHYILGPALKSVNDVPDIYIREFPKCRTEGFLIENQNATFYEWFHEHHRFWPTNDSNWVSWFQRVEDQKSYVWHQAGIYDILQFSKYTIPFNSSLVLAALCFWSTSTNSFHLGHGPLTVTLLDLSALVGLRPDGPEFDALVADSISIPDDDFGIDVTRLSNFSSFITEHNKIGGVVTDEEHVAFLLYWLCRYLLCSQSFKIVETNLSLAVALSRGESYALGPLVLAYLYRGIKDLLHSQLGTSGGPLWILQLWLHAYFPKLRPDCFSVPNPNLCCEGLKYVFYKEPELSFHDCLMYMCHLEAEENFNFIPYVKSDALPPWLIFPQSEMTETELSTLSDMWASFLISRDLPVGMILDKSRCKFCGVEAYCPNLCARQFGLIQGIPTPPFFSFNTHFPERTIFHGFEQFQVLKITTYHLFKQLQFVPFSVLPSSTSSFEGWWAKYYKQAFPHDQDLNYLFKLDDLDQNRPLPPPNPSDAFKKRKELTALQIEGPRSGQLQVHPPMKRMKHVTQQAKTSSAADAKEAIPLPKIQCLSGRGRAHSKEGTDKKAGYFLRSMIKGNYLPYAKSLEATVEKKSSCVSENTGTTPPLKKRRESARTHTEGRRSDQLQAHPPTKRIMHVARQPKSISIADGKEANPLLKFQCLSGQGRGHSKKRTIKKACHFLRSMIKGNYLSYAESEEATVGKKSSSVSENKGTNPPLKNQSQCGGGEGSGKRRITKPEVPHFFIDITKSNSLSHSETKEATFERNTGLWSKKRKSGAIDEGDIVELTEDDFYSKLKDLPLTQAADASNEKLPTRILSLPTQEVAEPQLIPEPSIQFPLHAQSSHPNSSSKESCSYHSGFHDKSDLKLNYMLMPSNSIGALDFLESYLLHHPDVCLLTKTEEAPIPDSDEISQAKAKIQSISTLSLDEVMEIDCLQNFKSSLEVLLKANGLSEVQCANIGIVREKLAFVESKYHSASGITAEVNKEFNHKIELEQEVEVYTLRFSDAQKEEPKILTCITVQKSIIAELEKKLAEEKAILKKLEEFHTTHQTKMNEFSYMLEHAQQMLHDHCIREKSLVMKAFQAKKDFKSVEAMWVQIQQLLSLIND